MSPPPNVALGLAPLQAGSSMATYLAGVIMVQVTFQMNEKADTQSVLTVVRLPSGTIRRPFSGEDFGSLSVVGPKMTPSSFFLLESPYIVFLFMPRLIEIAGQMCINHTVNFYTIQQFGNPNFLFAHVPKSFGLSISLHALTVFLISVGDIPSIPAQPSVLIPLRPFMSIVWL